MTDELNKLPTNWRRVQVREVISLVRAGFAFRKKGAKSGNLLQIRPYNIGINGTLDLAQQFSIPDTSVSKDEAFLEQGDVLFNNTNSVELVGKTALVTERMRAALSNHISLIRTADLCNGAWLALCLRALWRRGYFAQRCNKWIGQAGFNSKMLEETVIPLPPLDEQRRIVAKVETLMERVREAKRLRAEAEQDAWRLVRASTEEIFSGLGRVLLAELIASYKNGIYKPRQFYGRGYPSVRMFNIHNGRVNFERAPLLEVKDEELETFALKPDDILVIRVNGSRDLVGTTGLVPAGTGTATFESKIIRIRLKAKAAKPAFVVAALNSGIPRRQLIQKLRTSAGQFTVNQTDLNHLEIPFAPSLEEQARIMAYLDQIEAKVAALKDAQDRSATELERVEQAILDKAFRGEL